MIVGSLSIYGRTITVEPLSVAIASSGFFALLGSVASPAATDEQLAGILILDNALVGYLLPAALAATAALWVRSNLSSTATERVFGGTALLGTLAYILIQVRRGFVGSDLFSADGGSGELYAYSAAILLYGVALLALGFKLRAKDLRLAALAVVTVAICKAFLVDMAGLKGLLRALSLIGLGGSLVAIGLTYQRLLRKEASSVGTGPK